ncbi:DUF1570 domain-containing protein [Arcticibacter tournemirensis]
MKSKLLLSVLFLLLAQKALPQKLLINEIGFKLTEQERENIQLLSEYESQIYNGLFDTRRNDSLLITINLYKNFGDYKKASLAAASDVVSKTGFYSPRLKQIFVYRTNDFIRTLVHEMSHSFMHHNIGGIPRWFNEGLAVFFESMAVTYGQVSVAVQTARISAVKREIQSGDVNLTEFLQLDDEAWMNSKSKLDYMYNVSYSIVYFMAKSTPAFTKKLLLKLKEGRSSIDAIESLSDGGFDLFERRYQHFYR